jgi:hypothetical protein
MFAFLLALQLTNPLATNPLATNPLSAPAVPPPQAPSTLQRPRATPAQLPQRSGVKASETAVQVYVVPAPPVVTPQLLWFFYNMEEERRGNERILRAMDRVIAAMPCAWTPVYGYRCPPKEEE